MCEGHMGLKSHQRCLTHLLPKVSHLTVIHPFLYHVLTNFQLAQCWHITIGKKIDQVKRITMGGNPCALWQPWPLDGRGKALWPQVLLECEAQMQVHGKCETHTRGTVYLSTSSWWAHHNRCLSRKTDPWWPLRIEFPEGGCLQQLIHFLPSSFLCKSQLPLYNFWTMPMLPFTKEVSKNLFPVKLSSQLLFSKRQSTFIKTKKPVIVDNVSET